MFLHSCAAAPDTTGSAQAPTQAPRSFAASQQAGIPTKGLCMGYPRVDTRFNSDWIDCIAVIDQDLVFPRSIAVDGADVYLVDKGSNLFAPEAGRVSGTLYRYRAMREQLREKRKLRREPLLSGLDNPSGLAIGTGPNKQHHAYVSTPNQVIRVELAKQPNGIGTSTVIDDIATPGWHYLTAIHTTNDALFLMVPSATDHCEQGSHLGTTVQLPCAESTADKPPEERTAVIRRYKIIDDGTLDPNFDIIAQGLRDALAMARNPHTNELMAADNGWDQINLTDTPYRYASDPADEINVIPLNGQKTESDETDGGIPHYGWPYCFNAADITPPYRLGLEDCQNYVAPTLLLPAHSAPLGMAYIDNDLWLNLHGYAAPGHRTIAFPLSAQGHPRPPAVELIDWDFRHRLGFALGRPFALAVLDQHRVIITDDWNHALLMVVLKQTQKDLQHARH